MYGSVLLAIRLLLSALDAYARREQLYAEGAVDERDTERRKLLPVVVSYAAAILVGLLLPAVAVGLYCVIAFALVVPFAELRRLVAGRP